jgi:hypothetical protein
MTMMKTAILALTTLVVASGSALAAPNKFNRGYDGRGNVTPYERVAIAKASQHLSLVKRQAMRDGRISFFERVQIRNAEKQYFAALARAHRS